MNNYSLSWNNKKRKNKYAKSQTNLDCRHKYLLLFSKSLKCRSLLRNVIWASVVPSFQIFKCLWFFFPPVSIRKQTHWKSADETAEKLAQEIKGKNLINLNPKTKLAEAIRRRQRHRQSRSHRQRRRRQRYWSPPDRQHWQWRCWATWTWLQSVPSKSSKSCHPWFPKSKISPRQPIVESTKC